MPLYSMTGFGAASGGGEGFSVSVEISSVNRKQLDVSVSLPHGMNSLEQECRNRISSAVRRGRVQCSVVISSESFAGAAGRFDIDAIQAYLCDLEAVSEKTGLLNDVTLSSLMVQLGDTGRFARVISPEEARPVLSRALDAALEKLTEARRTEGAVLESALVSFLDAMKNIKSQVAARAPAVPVRYRDVLLKRIENLGAGLPADSEALAREVAFFADKCDISEELDRLEAHFIHFSKAMAEEGEPSGRMLDFICQEMGREINTIGSKANDAFISSMVLDFKSKLEALREQVQNVE